jgi:hypothetical protein
VTTGLVLAIAAALRLPRPLQVLAGLAAALLPLNHLLHGVGRIDHHFMEYTFVLLALLGGVRWFAKPESAGRAAFLGASLGIAPGFHNALFILQLPVLAALFLVWVRSGRMSQRATGWFSGALLAGCLLIVIPSEPFLNGWFRYYLLSTFHLYIAACTAVIAFFLASGPFSMRRLAILAAVAAAMLVPVLGQVSLASDFFGHRVERLSEIMEARSLLTILTTTDGATQIATQYSCLVFLAPLVLAGLAFWFPRTREPDTVFFIVFSVFGLLLLLQQFRMHYFGSFALTLPLLVAAAGLLRRYPQRATAIYAATAILFAGSFFPPIRDRVFANFMPGLDSHYQIAGVLMPDLSRLCSERPGTAFIWNDAGHYVRFHTECSVIANNFLLTPQHSDKIAEVDAIAAMSLDQVLTKRPDIDYLLVYYTKIWKQMPDGSRQLLSPEELNAAAGGTAPLFRELLSAGDPTALPGLVFVNQVAVTIDDGDLVLARLFAVDSSGKDSGG